MSETKATDPIEALFNAAAGATTAMAHALQDGDVLDGSFGQLEASLEALNAALTHINEPPKPEQVDAGRRRDAGDRSNVRKADIAAQQPENDDLLPALQRVRQIALQSEIAPHSMGEIIKRVDVALEEDTPLPAWITLGAAAETLSWAVIGKDGDLRFCHMFGDDEADARSYASGALGQHAVRVAIRVVEDEA